jgi:hypothetical protein
MIATARPVKVNPTGLADRRRSWRTKVAWRQNPGSAGLPRGSVATAASAVSRAADLVPRRAGLALLGMGRSPAFS